LQVRALSPIILKPLAKITELLRPAHQESGLEAESRKEFLAVYDDTMLDRWIPDEDWIHQIQDNGNSDCSISNLNMGMSRQCLWQNNCATLQGIATLHNKKHVQISKDKTKVKAILFYYALSASKPSPAIPSDQGFYQSLWDDR
jgi:hypothetical protein